MLPVTITDPVTNKDPLTSRVSALLDNNTPPESPLKFKAPETFNEPVTLTA